MKRKKSSEPRTQNALQTTSEYHVTLIRDIRFS